MTVEKQDANLVGFYKARETVLGAGAAPGATWETLEPNTFTNFGGDYKTAARKPFSPSRQRRKGSIIDLDATGGMNIDLTQNNVKKELEEFFFAARYTTGHVDQPAAFSKTWTASSVTSQATFATAHGLLTGDGPFLLTAVTTLPAGLSAATPYWIVATSSTTVKFATSKANAVATVPVTVAMTDTGTGILTMARAPVASASDNSYTVNSVPASVKVGALIMVTGFTNSANNGLKHVTAVTVSKITVLETLVNEANPPQAAEIKAVGTQAPASDISMAVNLGATEVIATFTLVSASKIFANWALIEGSWMFIGGDAANTYLMPGDDAVRGYARIANGGVALDGSSVTFDKSTFIPEVSTGTGDTIQLFFSDIVKNESDPDLIIRYSSILERTLGNDGDGTQSEYIVGAVANTLTWNSPLSNLVTLDMAYIGQKSGIRPGSSGPLSSQAGMIISPALGEDAFNTSSNIFRLRMTTVDPDTLNPTPFFAQVTEWKMTINNNVKAAKAQGILGGFDTTLGNFEVDGTFTAYFSDTDAIHAVQCNYDVTFDAIYAKNNAGIYMDIPLIGLGGGLLDIAQDAAIMIPLTAAAAESPFGHTAMVGWFAYLPDAGMPDIDC